VAQEQIVFWLEVLPFLTGMLLFAMLVCLSYQHPPELFLKACEEWKGLLQEKNQNSGWYLRTGQWLNQNGAPFHYGRWMTPTVYLAIRIVLGFAGMLVMGQMGMGYGMIVAILLFFLPGWMLSYLNRKDNQNLLPELKLVYHSLEIQIRAGVYVMDAMSECYGCVREPRLKQALLELSGDLVMKADVYSALDKFQGRFDNPYIDSLCITLLQAMESGQAVELLSDISEQIKDMEGVVLERKKSSLDRSITFYQLGILAAVMGVVLYTCITHMYSSAMRF